MANPIDVGPPTLTGRVGNRFNPANGCSEFRVWLRPHASPGENDLSIFFVNTPDIHQVDEFVIGSGVALTADELTRNLHMLNALSYHDQPFNKVLLDVLLNQAHVGCGVLRMVPNLDSTPLNWARSSGAGTWFSHVDEFPEEVSLADHLETTTPGNAVRLWLPALPSNATIMQEVILYCWTQMRRGTDTGMAITAKLYNDGFIQTSRTMQLDQVADDTPWLATCKFDSVDESVGWNVGGLIELVATRGAAGGAPNPRWRVYSIAGVGYFEVASPAILNAASFTAHDATYASDLLEFSVHDGTFRSLALDILKHRPEAFLWVAYDGALTFGRMKSYVSVGSPLDLTPMITAVRRGVYSFTERVANHVQIRYGVKIRAEQGSITTPSAVAEEDPNNYYPPQGSKRLRRSSDWTVRRGFEKYKVIDRRYFAGGSSADGRASSSALAYLNIWKKEPDAIDITCTMRAIECENGDVVLVNRPDLGLVNRKFCVVEKSLDLDADQVLLTLYDVEYTL